MKFKVEFENDLKGSVALLERAKKLMVEFGRVLAKRENDDNALAQTLLDFGGIAHEASRPICECLRNGHLHAAYVLLRWYLEACHTCITVWHSRKYYQIWKSGKQIRPEQIGKYFESIAIAPWKETYKDWSDAVHSNASFVNSAHLIAASTQKNRCSEVLVRNALMNCVVITHKFNMVFVNYIVSNNYAIDQKLIAQYNLLESEIIEMSKEQTMYEGNVIREGTSGEQNLPNK